MVALHFAQCGYPCRDTHDILNSPKTKKGSKMKFPQITPVKKTTLKVSAAALLLSLPFACFGPTIFFAYFLAIFGGTTAIVGSLIKKF